MTKKQAVRTPLKKQTMADQLAEEIKNRILLNEWESGEALPTEPEISEQFGVSRAVVREATRILKALGLVEAQHGRGVFVTEPKNNAFGDALLLALQRAQASVWDVEQFEQALFPEILAMATEHASEEDIQELEQRQKTYLDFVETYNKKWWGQESPPEETDQLIALYRQFAEKLFAATHNKVIEQLAQPLMQIRNVRNWAEDDQMSPEEFTKFESISIGRLLHAVKSRNADEARKIARQSMKLPPEAIAAMKETPVGEVPVIEIAGTKSLRENFDQRE